MIEGIVNADLEAVIEMDIVGLRGSHLKVTATLDTGFNGFLTLPPALVQALGLRRVGRGRAILAHGGEEIFDFYGATVIWNGEPRRVQTSAMESDPLIGMEMLAGYDLFIEVDAGGRVLIQPRKATRH